MAPHIQGVIADAAPGYCGGMILLGIVLLVLGLLFHVGILWTLGIIALVIGLILLVAGGVGHAVGGRKHWW